MLSVLPEILEPIRRHFGVPNRVHDVFVAHVVLQGSSVVPIVGELVAGGVSQHVRVDREREPCGFPSPGDRLQELSTIRSPTAIAISLRSPRSSGLREYRRRRRYGVLSIRVRVARVLIDALIKRLV